jgi:archaellum biogenesis protein FlaJ (TadC family)
MWSALETYRDVVTNSLDLVSFLLLTPELLRYAQPLIKNLIFYVALMFSFVLLVVFDVVAYALRGVETSALLGTAIIAAGFLLLWLFLIYLPRRWMPIWERHGWQTAERISAHSFQFGVVLFLISRAIGFAVALHTTHAG